jgi:hypothetical protein
MQVAVALDIEPEPFNCGTNHTRFVGKYFAISRSGNVTDCRPAACLLHK